MGYLNQPHISCQTGMKDKIVVMEKILLPLILIFVIGNFFFDGIVDHLNQKSAQKPLTPELKKIYTTRDHEKSLAYGRAKYELALISSSYSFIILVAALLFDWFAKLDHFVRDRVNGEILVSLAFIGSALLITSLISIPFSIYGTFVLEEKFEFNKTTPKVFITDLIKTTALTLLLGGTLLTLILWIYQELTSIFWLMGWAVISGFSLLMFMFGTSIILPLFNKLKPVEKGPLRSEIEKYCASQGYSLGRLFVMDGSKRSTKANAFFSGLGKSKTIVLFDTLIEKLETKEIVAVLAHEIGHYKRKHTLWMFIFANFQTFVLLYLLGFLLKYPELSSALGVDKQSFHISVLAFTLLFTPLSMLLGFIANSFTRRNEYDADTFAKNTYEVAPMKSALHKISTDSLANLSPHPLYVALNYTHPPLAQRLANLERK